MRPYDTFILLAPGACRLLPAVGYGCAGMKIASLVVLSTTEA
jgi:hypothetical protein